MSGTTYLAGKKQKIYIGSQKITKAFVGGKQVYSSGSLVTYNVDGSIYTEEVEEGLDVLHPSSFTPSKTNYTFYGWTQTSGSTQREENLVATGDPMTLYAIFLQTEVTFAYTGNIQYFTAKRGVTYQLKVWGAQGGSSGGTGGYGGYAVGNLAVALNTTLYVVVGGAGNNTAGSTAFNGGGTCYGEGAGGGGATHIGKSNATLANTAKDNLYIVAGGGGGAGHGPSSGNSPGGGGGGASGSNGAHYSTNNQYGTGGTQTDGGYAASDSSLAAAKGSYGQGGTLYDKGISSWLSGGAGGGGLYGGGCGYGNYNGVGGGGGGSGYTGGVTSGSMYQSQRPGNGEAKIVIVSVS